MRVLETLTARAMRSDMAQLFTLFLAALVVVLGFAWPATGTLANESWFSLAPARNTFLALAAAGFGASQALIALPGHLALGGDRGHWLAEARYTLGALLLWVLLSVPFEVVSHAGSYPATSLAWSSLVAVLTVPAYYGLGLLLRKLVGVTRLGWLLPIAVPGVTVFLAWLDLRLDTSLFNPWTSVLAPSSYALVAGAATLLTLLYLFGPWRFPLRARRSPVAAAPTGGGSS